MTLGGGITIINISLSFFFTASPMDPQLYSGLKNPEIKHWRNYKNFELMLSALEPVYCNVYPKIEVPDLNYSKLIIPR